MLTNEQIKELQYICITEHHSVLKIQMLLCITTWRKLEDITLNKDKILHGIIYVNAMNVKNSNTQKKIKQ